MRIVQQDNTYITIGDQRGIDFASVHAQVRVSIETYLTLFELYFEHPTSSDIFKYRFLIWSLKGHGLGSLLIERLPELISAYDITNRAAQIEAHKNRDARIKNLISETQYYRHLSSKYRKSLDRNLETPSTYFIISLSDRGWGKLISDAGLNQHLLAQIYSTTSSYIHSDAYSAWEANCFNNFENPYSASLFMFVSMALIGKIILNFVALSKPYREISEQQPHV